MAKMLAWPNTKRLNRRYPHLLHAQETKRRAKAALRRRNRAHESSDLRREVTREVGRPHHVTWVEAWSAERPFDMNDEYSCPSAAVWRALVEDDYGLRDVDFTGVYTTESEKV